MRTTGMVQDAAGAAATGAAAESTGSSVARCSRSHANTSSRIVSSERAGAQPVAAVIGRVVGDVVRHVGVACPRVRGDGRAAAGALAAEGRQLGERDAVRPATADVVDRAGLALDVGDLPSNQIVEVGDVQHVADLQAFAAEADVGQAAAVEVPCRPQHEESLIDFSHLPGARDDAAAIHDRPKPVHRAILLDEQLRGELGRAVHRAIARRAGTPSTMPLCRPARSPRPRRQCRAAARDARAGAPAGRRSDRRGSSTGR